MMRTSALASLLTGALLIGCVNGPQNARPQETAGVPRMSDTRTELPFELKEEDLKHVEILLGQYPAKTGAGKQEITIRGDGRVTLMRMRAYDSPQETREGQLPRETIIRLLELMDDQEFLALDDIYPTKSPVMRRLVRLSVPGRSKVVAVDEPGPFEFERVIGAIKLSAGLATPDALQRRFFSYP